MNDTSTITFSGRETAPVRTMLRQVLGHTVEQFSVQTSIVMISDEIEQLRGRGKCDAEIARLVTAIVGKPISAEMVSCHYAARKRGHLGRA